MSNRSRQEAEILRRRVALYRGYLREGVSAELTEIYLRTILVDEAEIAEIEARSRER